MKTFALSSFFAIAFALASLPGAPAIAAEYPWCLRSSGEASGGPRCRYATFEQCQAAYAYVNGWCERNARAAVEDAQARKRGR